VQQPSVPFGGYKESGFGRDLGEYALHEYTQVGCICSVLPAFDRLRPVLLSLTRVRVRVRCVVCNV
jgi:hypothetical protein